MATAMVTAMMKNKKLIRQDFSSVPLCRALLGKGLLVGLAVLPQLAGAGDWKLDESVTAGLTYVDRTGNTPSKGSVLQVSPQVSLKGQGGRSEADINYRLTASQGFGDTDPASLAHNLRARGRVEVIENEFFVGANASAQLVGSSSSTGPVDAINVDSSGRQSYSVQLTPEFRHHLNRYADIVSQNRIDYVTYDGKNVDGNDDSRSVSANLGIRSGRYFGPLDWSLDVTQSRTKYDLRNDKRKSYDLGVGYRFNNHWRGRGQLGYEKNDVQSNRNDTDGATWNLGFDWTPNSRTSFSAQAGKRYLGTVFSGSARHNTRRTSLSLDFSRDVTNRRSTQLLDSFLFDLDADGNVILDPVTGLPNVVYVPQAQQTDEDYVSEQIRGVVSIRGRRTTASLTASFTNRDYEVSDSDEDAYSLSLAVTRQLGGRISASLRSSLSSTDSGAGNDSDTYDVQFTLSKQLSRRTSVNLDLLRRERDASTINSDYTENRIGVSLSSSFF